LRAEVIDLLTIASATGMICWQPIAALTDEIAHAVGDIGIEEASAVICKPGRQLEQRSFRDPRAQSWNALEQVYPYLCGNKATCYMKKTSATLKMHAFGDGCNCI